MPLTAGDVQTYMPHVPGWVAVDNKKIEREFECKDFAGAMALVNKVGDLAEREGHHPDIYIHDWNKVRMELSTHAIHGLSENDFILAAKINTLM